MIRSGVNWRRALAVLAALGLLLAACGNDDTEPDAEAPDAESPDAEGSGDEPGPAYGGTITVGLEAESNTWTPGSARMAYSGHTVVNAIYDPLVALNADGEFEPFLAESLEPNDDLTQWTLTLREGVVFHDGTPLDAETLKWNFDTLHFHSGSLSWGFLGNAGLVGMEIVDELTVRYDLSEPNAAFPDVLTLPAGWPVSQEAYEADPEGFGDQPVGTGPFVVQQWSRDDQMVVTRNESYWRTDDDGNQLPYLDQIIFRPLPDEVSRLQNLRSGDVDVLQSLRGSTISELIERAEEGEIVADLNVGNFSESVILNVLEPPLDDLRIRQALALSHDPEQVQTVLGLDGLVEVRNGFYSEDSPWYSDAVANAHHERDVEAARALVEEYRDDPDRSDELPPGSDVTITFNCEPDPSLVDLAALHQALWEDAGLVVELRQLDAPTNIANVVGGPETDPPFRGSYSTSCWRAGAGAGDPLTAFQTFFGPVETNPANFTNFTHPEIDEQLEIIQTSLDFDERYAAVERIGMIAAEHVPVLWSTPSPSIVAFRSDLHGIVDWRLPSGSTGTGTALGIPRFHQAYLAD